MSDIFLSYKSEDKTKAQTIAKALEQKGYSVWWDRVIPPGRTFDDVIEENLDASKCVVVLWSKESVKSQWVRTEASEGNRRRILIPILIEEVQPPLAFRMIEAANLIDWDGKLPNHEFNLLLESVSTILGRPISSETDKEVQEETEPEARKKVKKATGRKKIELPVQREKKIEKEELSTIYTNSFGMKFSLIPKGEYMMGSEKSDNEMPIHKVTIMKPFYLGMYPVTQREWKEIIGSTPSYFTGDNFPVESVSWNDVQDFIRKLNEREKENYYYRLPTEAEWEYAARAGTTTSYSFGDDESKLGDYAWFIENSGSKTHEVGQKNPNPWGLHDMHGNVWEWVQDIYHSSYKIAPTDGSSWEIGASTDRIVRGGGWRRNSEGCRSAIRFCSGPDDRSYDLGFRLVMVS